MSITKDDSAETGEATWRSAASRVADELRLDPATDRTAKVSSLLHAFRGQGVHCDIEDMFQALLAQGVTARSPGREISRRDVLDLHLGAGTAPGSGSPGVEAGIRVSLWQAGDVGRPRPLAEAGDLSESGPDAVRWFDVDPRGGEPSVEAVSEVTELLRPWCPQLSKVIVRETC